MQPEHAEVSDRVCRHCLRSVLRPVAWRVESRYTVRYLWACAVELEGGNFAISGVEAPPFRARVALHMCASVSSSRLSAQCNRLATIHTQAVDL